MAFGVIKITPAPDSYLLQGSVTRVDATGREPASIDPNGPSLVLRGVLAPLCCLAGLALVAFSTLGHEVSSLWPFDVAHPGLKAACVAYKADKYQHNQQNPLLAVAHRQLDSQAYRDWLVKGDQLNTRLLSSFVFTAQRQASLMVGDQSGGQALARASAQCYAAGVDFGDLEPRPEFPSMASRIPSLTTRSAP